VFANQKNKVEAKVADKKTKVAITKEDSMFKNISLPGGISTKATEYKELARRGDRWESEVFSIGSANPTTDIPRPRQITRKSPYANRRSVRDREAGSVGGASRDSGYHANEPHAYGTTPTGAGFGDKMADGQYDTTGSRRLGEYTLNRPVHENHATNFSTPIA
jgi:DNA ligase-4